jgi:hypothetical protein
MGSFIVVVLTTSGCLCLTADWSTARQIPQQCNLFLGLGNTEVVAAAALLSCGEAGR